MVPFTKCLTFLLESFKTDENDDDSDRMAPDAQRMGEWRLVGRWTTHAKIEPTRGSCGDLGQIRSLPSHHFRAAGDQLVPRVGIAASQ